MEIKKIWLDGCPGIELAKVATLLAESFRDWRNVFTSRTIRSFPTKTNLALAEDPCG
jgi:hypothetical protein